MPKKNSTADIFLQGAARRVDEKETARRAQEAAQKQEELERQAERDREAARLKKAFPAYYAKLEPLLKTLEGLPPDAEGNEFFIRADLYVDRDRQSGRGKKSLDIWLLYTQEDKTQGNAAGAPNRHCLALNRKGTPKDERDDIDLALNGKPSLKLEMRPDADGKTKLESRSYVEYYTYIPPRYNRYSSSLGQGHYESRQSSIATLEHKSLDGFVAAVGSWAQDAAPHRIPEITAALGAGAKRIPTERMTVSKPLRLARKKTS